MGRIFHVDSRRKVRVYHTTRRDALVVVEVLGQSAAVSVIYIAKSVVEIQNLICPRIDFLMSIIVEAQWKNLYGPLNVTKH